MPPFRRFLLLSDEPADPLRPLLRDIVSPRQVEIVPHESVFECDSSSLAVLSWTGDNSLKTFERLAGSGARVVVQIGIDAFDPHFVAEHLGAGLAYCFRGETLTTRRSHVVQSIAHVAHGDAPFGSFSWKTVDGSVKNKPSSIFLARPDSIPEFKAVPAVLKKLGIACFDPLRSGGGSQVGVEVRDGVNRADGVIAYLGQRLFEDRPLKKRFVSYNPNVMYELGYASSAGKPFVLFGDEKDPDRWPADLQGHSVNTFIDVLHLVQHVYYGLV